MRKLWPWANRLTIGHSCPARATPALPLPNPTTGATTIGYRLPPATRQAHLLLRDLTGRTLRRLPL